MTSERRCGGTYNIKAAWVPGDWPEQLLPTGRGCFCPATNPTWTIKAKRLKCVSALCHRLGHVRSFVTFSARDVSIPERLQQKYSENPISNFASNDNSYHDTVMAAFRTLFFERNARNFA